VGIKKFSHLLFKSFSKKRALVNLEFDRTKPKMAFYKDSQKRRTSNQAQILWSTLVIGLGAFFAIDYIQSQQHLAPLRSEPTAISPMGGVNHPLSPLSQISSFEKSRKN
jgi:hypothetical protein